MPARQQGRPLAPVRQQRRNVAGQGNRPRQPTKFNPPPKDTPVKFESIDKDAQRIITKVSDLTIALRAVRSHALSGNVPSLLAWITTARVKADDLAEACNILEDTTDHLEAVDG